MATFKFFKGAPRDDYFPDEYIAPLQIDYHSGIEALYFEAAIDGNSVTLKGKNFAYDVSGSMVAGVVTSVHFAPSEGAPFASITGLKISATALAGEPNIHVLDLLAEILKGKDKVVGTSADDFLFGYGGADELFGHDGNDTLRGHAGKDRYDGGQGSDTFVVGIGHGHDTVVDFDADGGGAKQDYLDAGDLVYTKTKFGENTLVDFDNGDSVLLIGVKRNQINDSDFLLSG